MQKASLTALNQFFPGFSAQGMLQIGDAFEMSVSENSTVDSCRRPALSDFHCDLPRGSFHLRRSEWGGIEPRSNGVGPYRLSDLQREVWI